MMPVWLLAGACLAGPGACADPTGTGGDPRSEESLPNPLGCDLDLRFVAGPLPRDGIPALTRPGWTRSETPRYLDDGDRVVGFVVGGVPWAVPLNLLWYHEIANVTVQGDRGSMELAVTYCPLTGSSLVFDRGAVGGSTFGVSGLLYKSNLIMYDRATGESLWPQMLAESRCGPARGTALPVLPSVEMTWAGWRSLHPDSWVLGRPEWDSPYRANPYADYEARESYSYPMPDLDTRRPLKERVLGIGGVDGLTRAFPFGTLETMGPWAAVAVDFPESGEAAVVLWDGGRRSAMAYRTRAAGRTLTFTADPEGLKDLETGSRWTVEGRAVSGPLVGAHLEPLPRTFVAFWGAWYAFFPNTGLWGPGKPREP